MIQEKIFWISFEGNDICIVDSCPNGPANRVVVLVHRLGRQKNSETHIATVEAITAQGIATLRFDFPS